jgi:hypothetical protein
MSDHLPALSTANMAEVLFLLERGNRIVDVGLEPTMDGTSVFSVRFEGTNLEADHSAYLTFPSCSLFRLPVAFHAIDSAIRDKNRLRAGGVI